MRVDFYVTTNSKPDAIWLLACRLVEKAYHRGHRVFIHCQNQPDAELIDELLWTYKDDSFIPHNLQGEGPEPPPPVQIGFTNEPRGFNDILLNLSAEIPKFYTRFNRVIELVGASEEAKVISRQRYKDYRLQGCDLHMHTIG